MPPVEETPTVEEAPSVEEVFPTKKPPTVEKLPPVENLISNEQKKQNELVLNKKISSKQTGNSLVVTWNKVPDADGYDIYALPVAVNLKT